MRKQAIYSFERIRRFREQTFGEGRQLQGNYDLLALHGNLSDQSSSLETDSIKKR